MTEWIIALAMIVGGATQEHGIASVFGGRNDKHRGGASRCLRPMRQIRADDWGIATRTGRCGEPIFVMSVRTGRWTIAPRIDAGPYGARLDDDSWALKKRSNDPGEWIGIADLTRPVAEAIGHRGGKERVIIMRMRR